MHLSKPPVPVAVLHVAGVWTWDAGGNASGAALGGLISYGQSLTAGRPTTVGKHRPTVLSWLTRPDGPTLAGSRFGYYMHYGLDHTTGSNVLYALGKAVVTSKGPSNLDINFAMRPSFFCM